MMILMGGFVAVSQRNTTRADTLSVLPREMAESTSVCAARAPDMPVPMPWPPVPPHFSRIRATASSSVMTSHTPSQAIMINWSWKVVVVEEECVRVCEKGCRLWPHALRG